MTNDQDVGMTRVFFKSGQLSELDRVMESAGLWVTDPSTASQKQAVVKLSVPSPEILANLTSARSRPGPGRRAPEGLST